MKNVLIIIIILNLLFSCESKEINIKGFDIKKDEKLINALQRAYSINAFNINPTPFQLEVIIKSLERSSSIYKKAAQSININSLRLFENKKERIVIAIFEFNKNPDKYFSIKGYMQNGLFIITNEFLFARKIENSTNGKVIITNNNEATIITFENGLQTYSEIGHTAVEFKILQIKDCEGNHGGTGFCQRQSGERFSDCYNAEKDEFCDGFWSCLAVDTQPQVMILIAAACGCSATICP